MCGFIGLISEQIDKKKFEESLDIIKHRGPDNTKILFDNRVCLGFNRLAINDLSINSDQPFDDKYSSMVFNGEIYNFKDLNRLYNLNARDNSDALVLYELIKIKREKALQEINGMFSFAFYDKKNNFFLAARDKFGEKPFYYSLLDNGDLIFASEIKALKQYLKHLKIDIIQVKNYFKQSYPDIDKTIYQNIFSLPPSHFMTYKNNKLEIHEYFYSNSTSYEILDYERAKKNLKSFISNSIKKRLEADVEVGIFLSGGIDSTLVLSLASQMKKNLSTFSFGFKNSKNELKEAQYLSSMYNTKHYSIDDTDVNLLNLIIKMQSIFDQPFSDSSCLPLYVISKKASKYVKSVMTGDGGDELFYGYTNWYSRVDEIFKYMKLKKIPFAKQIIKANFFKDSSVNKYLNLIYNSNNIADLFSYLKSPFSYHKLVKLGLIHNPNQNPIKINDKDTIKKLIKNEIIRSYLSNNILVKSDMCSMANSLEIRAPLLDYELFNYVNLLPYEYFINKNYGKKILRDLLSDMNIPSNVIKRKKQGFGSPVKNILQNKQVNEAMHDSLLNKNSKIFNFIDFDEAQKDIKYLDQKVWTYFNFDLWLNYNS